MDRTYPCPFCEIVSGVRPATIVGRWPGALAIVPLNPVTPGHLLVIPTTHVSDATDGPLIFAAVAAYAAQLAGQTTDACNLITSCGSDATQTVFHLHMHIVPRTTDDGLQLPWAYPRPQPRTFEALGAAMDAAIPCNCEPEHPKPRCPAHGDLV
jgi:histidine triad (HIT) family protein